MEDEGSNVKPEFSILVYMAVWCPDCVAAHKLLKRSGLPFTLIDIELVPGAEKAMIEAANGIRKLPTILIEGPTLRHVLIEPAVEELTAVLSSLKQSPN